MSNSTAKTRSTFDLLLELLSKFAENSCEESISEHEEYPTKEITELASRNKVLFAVEKTLGTTTHSSERTALRLAVISQLRRIAQKFEEENIPLLCIKGPALATMAYGTAVSRDYEDLDLLIRKKDRESAIQQLKQLGYDIKYPLTPAQQRSDFSTQHAVVLTSEDEVVEVDLHWTLAEKQYALPQHAVEGAWDRVTQLQIDSFAVNTLSAEDALLWSCIHGSKDLWIQLKHFLDIHMLVQNYDIDWDLVSTTCKESSTNRIVAVPLLLAKRLLGTDIPEELAEEWNRDSVVEQTVEQIEQQLRRGGPFSELQFAKINLRLRESPMTKTRYVIGRLCIPHESDWELAIPDRFFALHYIVKPFRTVSRALISVRKANRNNS